MNRLRILTPTFYAIHSHSYSYATKIYFNKINEIELDIDEANSQATAFSLALQSNSNEYQQYLDFKINKTKTNEKNALPFDDLQKAYEFAQKKGINKKNILRAHSICTKNTLAPKFKGKYRKTELILKDNLEEQLFETAAPEIIDAKMERFFVDIEVLLRREMRLNVAFYYASYIHACFMQVAPFAAGNEIVARLLEKWFLARKLDTRAWYIPSEEYYYNNNASYFENFIKIGLNFKNRNFENALDFGLMLTKSLEVFNKVEEE